MADLLNTLSKIRDGFQLGPHSSGTNVIIDKLKDAFPAAEDKKLIDDFGQCYRDAWRKTNSSWDAGTICYDKYKGMVKNGVYTPVDANSPSDPSKLNVKDILDKLAGSGEPVTVDSKAALEKFTGDDGVLSETEGNDFCEYVDGLTGIHPELRRICNMAKEKYGESNLLKSVLTLRFHYAPLNDGAYSADEPYRTFSEGSEMYENFNLTGSNWSVDFLYMSRLEYLTPIFMAGVEFGGGLSVEGVNIDQISSNITKKITEEASPAIHFGPRGVVNPYIGLAPFGKLGVPFFITAEAKGETGFGYIFSNGIDDVSGDKSNINFYATGGLGLGVRVPISINESSNVMLSLKTFLLQATASTIFNSTDFGPSVDAAVQYQF